MYLTYFMSVQKLHTNNKEEMSEYLEKCKHYVDASSPTIGSTTTKETNIELDSNEIQSNMINIDESRNDNMFRGRINSN